MKIRFYFARFFRKNIMIIPLILCNTYPRATLAETLIKKEKCPNNLEELANSLVTDIPDYANRVIQRSRIFSHSLEFFPIYVITAGKPELNPLELNQTQYKSDIKSSSDDDVKQVFFTTLERQYSSHNRIITTQNFHWLMLTETPQGWKMVLLLTKLGYPDDFSTQNFISSPPRDSSKSIIGQSVQLWLRDCQAQN